MLIDFSYTCIIKCIVKWFQFSVVKPEIYDTTWFSDLKPEIHDTLTEFGVVMPTVKNVQLLEITEIGICTDAN